MNRNYMIIAIVAVIIIAIIGFFAFSGGNSTTTMASSGIKIDAGALQEQGVLKVESESQNLNNGLFSSNSSDENSVLVKNNGNLKLENSIINKTGDTQTSGDDADFYGVNSAVLVNTNGTLDISNVEINTNSKGSNAIFVTNAEASTDSANNNAQPQGNGSGEAQPPEAQGGNGAQPQGNGSGEAQPPEAQGGNGAQPPEAGGQGGDGGQPPEMPEGSQGGGQQPGQATVSGTTSANINNVKITTHQDKSRGLDATYGGTIKATNVEINTNGNSCAALATDRGEGNVSVSNSNINTGVDKQSGRGSPLIYSTGNITLSNSQGTSYVSQIACIEGKNSISLDNCQLTGFGEGNRKDGDNYVDLAGIFIYQSMSGDADIGTATFNCKNSDLTIDKESKYYDSVPMFHVTNTKANINLESSEFNFGSGILLDISGQSQWGNVGSNGGDVNLTAQSETLKGDIIVDSISSLNFDLKGSTFEGAINSTGNATVNVESGSTWTLTGDSNVTALENSGTVNLNGHKLLVNGVEYKG
jgi:hypothetical protein